MKKKNSFENWFKDDNRPVSVDIKCTVYNHQKYLRKALDGMLAQKTDFPVRIIIHDDASTDNSADIIREYKELYPDRIVAIFEEENLYQNGKSVFRKMYPYFTAKYIAFCEGDDYWIDENKLQKQVDYLEQNPDCVAVYHSIYPIDKNGEYDEASKTCWKATGEGDYSKYEIKNLKLKHQTSSLVYRNYNLWITDEQLEFFINTQSNGDEKMFILFGLAGRIHFFSEAMSAYRYVDDEGDSWHARFVRKSPVERIVDNQKRYIEKCRLYTYLSNEYLYPYNTVIEKSILFVRRKSLPLTDLYSIFKTLKIPFYSYLLFIPHFICVVLRWMYKKKVCCFNETSR